MRARAVVLSLSHFVFMGAAATTSCFQPARFFLPSLSESVCRVPPFRERFECCVRRSVASDVCPPTAAVVDGCAAVLHLLNEFVRFSKNGRGRGVGGADFPLPNFPGLE